MEPIRSKSLAAPRIFALGILLLVLFLMNLSWKSPVARDLRKGAPIYILLIGTDWVDYARHSDAILLAAYFPNHRSLDLLSIPRDTKIDYPSLKIRRLNEIYAFHYRTKKNHHSASQGLADAVRTLLFAQFRSTTSELTVEAPEISYYLQVDYDGFKRMIDLLGGVEATVNEPMHYDDHWGKLHIHFERGVHLLNGQKALEFVRFRDSTGDYGRTIRAQEFMLNLFKTLKQPRNLLNLPRIFWQMRNSFQTNLKLFEKFLLFWEIKELPRPRIRLLQLPGKMSGGFWIPDPEGVMATAQLIQQRDEITEAFPAAEKRLQGKDNNLSSLPTTVEVWNASSKRGLALEVTRKLRRSGFDVVKWGDYESRQIKTFLRDQKGNLERAQALANALDPTRIEVFTRVEKNPMVDIVLILGEDYAAGE